MSKTMNIPTDPKNIKSPPFKIVVASIPEEIDCDYGKMKSIPIIMTNTRAVHIKLRPKPLCIHCLFF